MSEGGAELAVRVAGDREKPAILLIHELPNSSGYFRNVIRPLARECFVIAPDLPGFGGSEPIEAPSFSRSRTSSRRSGYTAEASAELSGGTLELRVIGTQPSSSRPVVIATGYEATVRGVSPGSLHIRVVHEYRGVSRPPAVVFEQDLRLQ